MRLKLVLIVLSSLIAAALACTCSKRSQREIYCAATFSAIVYIAKKADTCLEWHSCYQVDVRRRFKPASGVIRELVTANNSAACGHEFREGEEYLVHGQLLDLSSQAASKAEVYSCSMPVLWSTLTYQQKKATLAEIAPSEQCKKKRKRVL